MLCSCGNDRTKYYEERISSYEAIAEYALQNYASSDGSRVSIKLSDITENSLSKDIIVAEEKFTYIWIENNSVIFWNDEMKTLGLVYSDNAKSAIKDIEEWYIPGAPENTVYESISPVNSFRVIFNTYFDGRYELLPDEAYLTPRQGMSEEYVTITDKVRFTN